jgi:hypothetical protein
MAISLCDDERWAAMAIDCGRPGQQCSASVAGVRTVEDCTGQAALHRRTRYDKRHARSTQSLRCWSRRSQVAGHGGRAAGLQLAGAQVVFQGCRLPARVYLSRLSVQSVASCFALLPQHNIHCTSSVQAQVCSLPTLQPLNSVRHRLATALGTQTQRRHQPQPPAALCSAAPGTVQRPAWQAWSVPSSTSQL